MYVIGPTCFDECFYSFWQLEKIIFHESLSLPWQFLNHHVLAFFESSPYFALSPQQQCNINTKFNKNHRYYICYMFYTNFFFDYDLFFDYIWLWIRFFLQCFCFCDCSRSFFLNDFFLKKTKSLSKRVIFAISDNRLFIVVKSEISQKVSGFITCESPVGI